MGRKVASLPVFLALVLLTAAVGARSMPDPWYEQLEKPVWTPPNWVFGPAWTVLYVAIAVAGWLVWREAGRIGLALQVWGAQLIANALWSWLFFGLHRPGAAFVDIVAMLALIIAFMIFSRKHSVLASWLFVPYALWVTFAGSLNFWIWRAN